MGRHRTSYVRGREGPTQTKAVTQSLLLALLKGQPLQRGWGVSELGGKPGTVLASRRCCTHKHLLLPLVLPEAIKACWC